MIYSPDNWDKGVFVAACMEVHVVAAAVAVGNFEGPPPRTLLKDVDLNEGFGGSEGDYSEGVSQDIAL